ncbi:MAG: hypothetical protein AMXMBFR53_08690 [Gemmatimonadota bacterium]
MAMFHECPTSKLQRAAVVIAALFGLASVLTGGRVLLGMWDPGHVVVLPLVAFNTAMGIVYIAVARRIKSDAARGRTAAAGVAVINLVVLVVLLAYAATGGTVASDSFVAMTVRTGVWGGIVLALTYVLRGPRGVGA